MLGGFLDRLWCLDWCKERQIAPLSGEQYDTTALTAGGKEHRGKHRLMLRRTPHVVTASLDSCRRSEKSVVF
jgi:hypothetical protein